jgi:primase/DNA polymerase family protein/uncharacterized protein DUF3987
MFANIPIEMHDYRQWIVWRYEKREGAKDTKVPYSPVTQRKASVTNPDDWSTYAEAVAAFEAGQGELSGIGFVLTNNDPFAFIDLDDTHGDAEAYERQIKVFREFDSYSELSPSGSGLHIIVKGQLPQGRRRAFIELYSNERYMTMTGNVFNAKPIVDRQELLNLLWDQMGGPAATYTYGEDQAETQTDDEIITSAERAVNGDKFATLYRGDWSSLYPSQSEADFALVDIVAFYTQNRRQIARIFRSSQLGQREKAQRDRYIAYMVEKSFDRQLPKIDIEGLRIKFQNLIAAKQASQVYINVEPVTVAANMPTQESNGERGSSPEGSPGSPLPLPCPMGELPLGEPEAVVNFPPGLVGEVAQYIYDQAPRPVKEIALAGAIGFLSGITGRSYNVSAAGLNQYMLLLGPTGTGKEAISSGIASLMAAIAVSVPTAAEFVGPGELVSTPGLVKWLAKTPSIFCLIGEFGLKLKEMSSHSANANLVSLRRTLLDLYNKSGQRNVFNPMAYSDKDKNTVAIQSPSLTLIGESTPSRFYEALDESMIEEGLLPRFMIIEYLGERPALSKSAATARPSFALVERLASLVAQCLTLAHNRQTHDVPMTAEAEDIFDRFDKWCDQEINGSQSEVTRQLWNRAHIKSLKLAALIAVGVNYVNPMIGASEAWYATTEIAKQTNKLQDRFKAGDFGDVRGNEATQIKEVVKAISKYCNTHYSYNEVYGGTWEMHRDGVISHSHLQRRLISIAAFRHERIGGTNAIKRAIQHLLEGDDIREVPKAQMLEKYGTGARSFVIANSDRFRNSDV